MNEISKLVSVSNKNTIPPEFELRNFFPSAMLIYKYLSREPRIKY